MVPNPTCNLEHAWYFHVECPDYIKKYDHPVEGKKYLKQQMYNMLSLPYYLHRKENSNQTIDVPSLEKRNQYLEYSEVATPRYGTSTASLLLNSKLAKEGTEGVNFDADK